MGKTSNEVAFLSADVNLAICFIFRDWSALLPLVSSKFFPAASSQRTSPLLQVIMAPKERMTWESSDAKKLLELCIQEKAGSSGRKTNWSEIVQSLNVATAKNFAEKSARNKYDDLKKNV
ncbi:hypothetical protein DM860_017011 [Cuscuta australis]|uniref:Myb/SANT-like domain-containing protein n=1 Tax=Cuscuta australis TaxID=267555 RepID=A0A328DNZ8_9ASTE|nr:hypothetical protein DM860_017011 [Cuscuta australis]